MIEKITKFFEKRPVRAIFAIFALIFLLTAVFLCRKPVVFVSDHPFNLLYGEKRAIIKQKVLSLRLFRQVKTINIAEGAGPDLAAQAAASLSRRPLAVFFPYRYQEGARRYLKDRPGSVVVILGGRVKPPDGGSDPEPLWFCTDIKTDVYRAGAFAGIIARLEEGQREGNTPRIALYQDNLTNVEIAAFSLGLKEFWPGNQLLSPNLEEKDLACAVLLKEIRFNQEDPPRRLILFTWMDPVLAPGTTFAVFDDSPWAQIGPAINLLKKGPGLGLIPSEITVIKRDKALYKEYIAIDNVKSLKYKGENTDN